VVDRGFNSPNRKCSIRDFDLARLRVCPGKPGAGNPHAGFYLGGEAQGQPRLLPTDHHIDHERLLEMLRLRIEDRPFLRLIKKWLKAGVLDTDGQVLHPVTGLPQGGIVSPILANIYLHHVLDVWFTEVVQAYCKGQALLCRYADDCAPRA
jgi:Reverse transcriptase (RNA-dependent DNA polymerase)